MLKQHCDASRVLVNEFFLLFFFTKRKCVILNTVAENNWRCLWAFARTCLHCVHWLPLDLMFPRKEVNCLDQEKCNVMSKLRRSLLFCVIRARLRSLQETHLCCLDTVLIGLFRFWHLIKRGTAHLCVSSRWQTFLCERILWWRLNSRVCLQAYSGWRLIKWPWCIFMNEQIAICLTWNWLM